MGYKFTKSLLRCAYDERRGQRTGIVLVIMHGIIHANTNNDRLTTTVRTALSSTTHRVSLHATLVFNIISSAHSIHTVEACYFSPRLVIRKCTRRDVKLSQMTNWQVSIVIVYFHIQEITKLRKFEIEFHSRSEFWSITVQIYHHYGWLLQFVHETSSTMHFDDILDGYVFDRDIIQSEP